MSKTLTDIPPLPVLEPPRLIRSWWLVAAIALVVVLGAVLLVTAWSGRQAAAPTPVATPPPPPISASGTVVPEQRAMLSFTTGGRVSQLYVAEGDVVQRGQPLARLDPASLIVDPQLPVSTSDVYLIAPFTGTVGQLQVRPWETVTPGVPVLALGDLRWLRVEVDDLAEADVGQIWVGQPVEMTFEALPERVEAGRIASIAPMAAARQGRQTYRVIIDFAEPTPAGVRWGMTVNVDIIVAGSTPRPPA